MVTNHSWPLHRQSWPTTAFLIVCVFFFIVGSIARFRYLDAPALRDEENDQYDLYDHEQLSFDIRNGTTMAATSSSVSVLPSPKSSSYVDHQIESNLAFFNVSSSSETSSLESNNSEIGKSAVLPNSNNSLSQASKDEGNMENDDHTSQTQQQQKDEMQSTTQSPPTIIKQPHYFMEISLSRDNIQSIGQSTPEFVSTTLDWWPIGTKGWDNSSVINADLSHPRLVAAASGLRPYILRIGGSQADEILYNMVDEPWVGSMSGNNGTNIKNDDDDVYDSKIANECRKRSQKCLTKDRWDEVLNFAQQTGARIVFTLAYVRHTRGESNGENHTMNDIQDWDSRNARRFLEYTYAKTKNAGGTVYGFELGNELRHKKKISNITRVVNAYKELGDMIQEIWGDNYPRPKLLGPASTGVGETSDLLSQIGPYIQIASYHKYHGGGKDPKLPSYAKYPSFYPHPMKLSGPGEAAKKYITKMTATGNSSSTVLPQLWIGEGAMAYDSGLHGLTDTFHGSMWFANILGALTKTKPLPHSVYCRQSLLGGYYELISHETLIPNPDYWVAYLWKSLVGQNAIGPIVSPQRNDSVKLSSYQTFGCCKQPGADAVLIHSFCAESTTSNGDVVFIVINTSESKAMYLNVSMTERNRTEYILTPNKAEGMKSRQVFLNGQQLSLHENGPIGYALPDIRALGVTRSRGEQFHIPPISIAFLVVHETELKQCMPTTE